MHVVGQLDKQCKTSSGTRHVERHFVYVVECSDGTLYTGYTPDVAKRIKLHNEGKGAKYTRGRTPVTLRYVETFSDKRTALQRERAIKGFSRAQKLRLIESSHTSDSVPSQLRIEYVDGVET